MEQPDLFTSSLRNIASQSGCCHLFDKTSLQNGNVFCTAWRIARKREDRPSPGFGLYADYSWRPNSRNEFIDWPDFDIPANPKIACKQIASAYSLSKKIDVEIGCIGAHGRTGTILACMSIIDMHLTPNDAISFVRDTYCHSAIETSRQENFVEYFWGLTNEF